MMSEMKLILKSQRKQIDAELRRRGLLPTTTNT